MTAKEIVLLILGGVLANNYAFEKFLGLTPLLGFARRENKLTAMGLAVTVTMLLTAAIAWPVKAFVLAPLGLGFLQTLCFVTIILLVVGLVQLLAKLIFKKGLGVYFPLIALNSAVLGLAVTVADGGFTAALLTALGAGLGFLCALHVFAALRDKIDNLHVPKAFRGLPIDLLAAAIISMALVAFK